MFLGPTCTSVQSKDTFNQPQSLESQELCPFREYCDRVKLGPWSPLIFTCGREQ